MNESASILDRSLHQFPLETTLQIAPNWLIKSKKLAFNMEAQTQSNWCWAATSRSVARFYYFLPAWTQCKIAGAELGLTCCTGPMPAGCNVAWYLDRALTRTKNFVSFTGKIPFSQVKTEIDAGRPVGTRIGWSGGGGHFMVIYGYSESLVLGTRYLYIDDPIYGKSFLTYDTFATAYQGSGSWTHSYFTKSQPIFMFFNQQLLSENLVRKIGELRPLARFQQDPSLSTERALAPEPAELVAAHDVFTLGIDQLKKGELPTQRVSTRVLDRSERGVTAAYDLDTEKDEPVAAFHTNPEHLARLDRGIRQAETLVNADSKAELRALNIPALYTEALWIHHGDQGQDTVLPLRSFDFSPFEPVPLDEFMKRARQAAERVDLDELKGA